MPERHKSLGPVRVLRLGGVHVRLRKAGVGSRGVNVSLLP